MSIGWYRWDGQDLVVDASKLDAVSDVAHWTDLMLGDEWRDVYGETSQGALPSLKVFRHTRGVSWRIMLVWSTDWEHHQFDVFDVVTCDHLGELLPCVQYLLRVLESMHQVGSTIEAEARMFDYFGQSSGVVEAHARLVQSGQTPEQIEAGIQAKAHRDRVHLEALSRQAHDVDSPPR